MSHVLTKLVKTLFYSAVEVLLFLEIQAQFFMALFVFTPAPSTTAGELGWTSGQSNNSDTLLYYMHIGCTTQLHPHFSTCQKQN